MTTSDELGATLTSTGARFAVWAPRADAVELVLVGTLNRTTGIEMMPSAEGIWRAEVPGVTAGQHYGYRISGPWDPAAGIRCNRARIVLDPYARAIAGGLDFDGAILDHEPGEPQRPAARDCLGSVPLGVVVPDTEPPEPIARRRPMSETVIYEAHLRGLTRRHPAVPAPLRGSYLAMAEPAVVDYLVDLGITAVEFLPLHHFASEPFLARKQLRNYWGYNTVGFFAPHALYAPRDRLGTQVTDFKTMVSALHRAGIEVILDVVYNHTAEGGAHGPTLSFRGIDQQAYYRMSRQSGDYEDYDVTGCGNSIDTSHPMVRRLLLDSLRYWVTKMGVDGFRFDLATTLIRDEHHNVDQSHPFKTELAADPAFADIKIIAEPWDIGPHGYQVGSWGPGWHEWNDRFRDHVRDYWRGSVDGVRELATRLAGSPDLFDTPGRTPQHSINFVTAHDGFTLRDLVSYDTKHNLANGEDNRDGAECNRSWNHGEEGETTDPDINALRRRQVLNLTATTLLAAGTPMLLAGDEMGRTQAGNNNAYCQDSPVSWLDWNVDPGWATIRPRIRALISLRREHGVLRRAYFAHRNVVCSPDGEDLQRFDLAWLDGTTGEMTEECWNDSSRRLLGMYVADDADAFVTWFHSGPTPATITLPGLPWGNAYTVVWHSGEAEELPVRELSAGSQVTLPGRIVVVMRARVPRCAAELTVPASLRCDHTAAAQTLDR